MGDTRKVGKKRRKIKNLATKKIIVGDWKKQELERSERGG